MQKGREMNARQKAKKLKKDNKFLREIIYNTDELKRLYIAYTQPLEVKHTNMPIRTYGANARIEPMLGDRAIDVAKESIIRQFAVALKEHAEWRIVGNKYAACLEGRIYLVERGLDE